MAGVTLWNFYFRLFQARSAALRSYSPSRISCVISIGPEPSMQ